MKKILDTIKTFYLGTTKELKEKDSKVNTLIFAAEIIPTFITPICLALGEYGYAAITTPFAIDHLSRWYYDAKHNFDILPRHTPGIAGQIKEYYQNLEEKIKEEK